MALPQKIESRVGITAPAEVVWEAVSNLADWHEWNPLYRQASGALRIGEKLHLTLAMPDEPERDLSPTIVDWVPNEQILWTETVARGWIKAVRYIEIEALTPESCIFSNGEQYNGFIVPYWLNKTRRRARRKAFASLSEAVKERADALWGARAGGG